MRQHAGQRSAHRIAAFGQVTERCARDVGESLRQRADFGIRDVTLRERTEQDDALVTSASSVATASCDARWERCLRASSLRWSATALPCARSDAASTAARCCAMPRPLLVRFAATGNFISIRPD